MPTAEKDAPDPPPWDGSVDDMRRWAQRQAINSGRPHAAVEQDTCPGCEHCDGRPRVIPPGK